MYLTMVICFLFCRSPADRQRSNDAKTVNEQPNYRRNSLIAIYSLHNHYSTVTCLLLIHGNDMLIVFSVILWLRSSQPRRGV